MTYLWLSIIHCLHDIFINVVIFIRIIAFFHNCQPYQILLLCAPFFHFLTGVMFTMWFKNAKLYQLTQPLTFNEDNLQDCLSSVIFRPCGSQELATMGFTPPLTGSELLFHHANGRYLFSLKKQERILPAAVINAELAEKVAQIEQETGSPVGKKAQQDLKQEIVARLLPQAFTKNSFSNGFICPEHKLVIVDASADGKAETFLAMLRKALGSLPVVPLCRSGIQSYLTKWVTANPPEHIQLLTDIELKANDDEAAVARCKNQDLQAEEVLRHIDAGKWVEKLGVDFSDQLTCMLESDGSIKRIKYSDSLKEENQDIPKDEKAARLDADFVLMSAELVAFADYLTEVLELNAE